MDPLKKLFEAIISMLEDENGGTSTMRVVVMIGILTILFVWAFLSIKNNTLYSFEAKDIGLLATFLGSKVLQKGIESKEAVKLNGKS